MEYYKLKIESGIIIGTVNVPLNLDCSFVRAKYLSENKPDFYYDFLFKDAYCPNSLQNEYEVKFDYETNDLLNGISISQVQLEIENKFEPEQAEIHISNLTETNYIEYALQIGIELYTTLLGEIRPYELKPFCSLDVLESKSFEEVKAIIQADFVDFLEYFNENANETNYVEITKHLNFCPYAN
jgi:hypothetical protein